MAQAQEMIRCSFRSLPTEIMCSILKIVLESMVEDDMTTTPGIERQALVESLPFPHTMALVCRHWRNIVSSTPELWTRISWALPLEDQRVNFQLKKAGNYPVHLIIKQNLRSLRLPLPLILSHLQQLKSLIITDIADGSGSLGVLTGDAPQLEFLRLTDIRCYNCYIFSESRLKLECPALRTLYVDQSIACNLDYRWLKNNTQHLEVMTIYGGYPISRSVSLAISRALQTIPRRIPCLILDNLQHYPALAGSHRIKIWAKTVILRTCIRCTLAAFDGDCQTIVLQECDSIHELRYISLPSSDSLELDGCAAKFGMRWRPKTRPWNGNTVTITNSHSSCINIILYLLGAPFARHSCSLWPRVTTLKVVAKGDVVLDFPLIILKAMVSSRREAAGEENLGKDDEELDATGYDTVRPLMVLHVHGAQPLPCKEEIWFKQQVRDFLWD